MRERTDLGDQGDRLGRRSTYVGQAVPVGGRHHVLEIGHLRRARSLRAPDSGYEIYYTPADGTAGWRRIGGTSAASPFWETSE